MGMLVGQCPATVLSSFTLGSPWPPAAITDLGGKATVGCVFTTSKLGEELRKALVCWHPPAASAEGTKGQAQTSAGDSKCRPPPLRLLIRLSLGGVISGWAPSLCPHGILGWFPSPRMHVIYFSVTSLVPCLKDTPWVLQLSQSVG